MLSAPHSTSLAFDGGIPRESLELCFQGAQSGKLDVLSGDAAREDRNVVRQQREQTAGLSVSLVGETTTRHRRTAENPGFAQESKKVPKCDAGEGRLPVRGTLRG